jgi:hypothetical protein
MRTFPAFVLVVSAMSVSRESLAKEAPPVSTASIQSPTTRFAVERAARGARDRLERPECRRVLSDFRDASGRTLEENLELIGETPSARLARITFVETLDRRRCASPGVLAVGSVGGLQVFVCSPQFWHAYRDDPAHVEVIVIHEMMHTLGLAENPPTSAEINAQVRKRCR